jgi:hypothetical protein
MNTSEIRTNLAAALVGLGVLLVAMSALLGG